MKGKKEEITKNLKKEKSKRMWSVSFDICDIIDTQKLLLGTQMNDLYSWKAEMCNITIIIIKKEEQRLSMQE